MAAENEWFETDYYKVLGVSEKASDKEITRAYRKLAKELHPDVKSGSEEEFKKVSKAYDVLGDPQKKKEYDEIRKLGPRPSVNPGNFNGNFRVDDLSDVFSGLFNRSSTTSQSGGFGKRRGQDVETTFKMSFEDAIRGGTHVLSVVFPVTCHECLGSGSKKGSSPKICDKCSGTGYLQKDGGLFSLNKTCPKCGGKGTIIVDPCPVCSGTGREFRPQNITVKFAPGSSSTQRVRVRAKGLPGANGGPNGDLYVTLSVEPHPLFQRKGQDINLNVPVSIDEAILGTTISVPDVEGKKISIKIPPNCPNGRTFRIKGKGVTSKNKTGDLLVTVEVVIPKTINEAQKKAIEDFKNNSTEKQSVRESLERYIKITQEAN